MSTLDHMFSGADDGLYIILTHSPGDEVPQLWNDPQTSADGVAEDLRAMVRGGGAPFGVSVLRLTKDMNGVSVLDATDRIEAMTDEEDEVSVLGTVLFRGPILINIARWRDGEYGSLTQNGHGEDLTKHMGQVNAWFEAHKHRPVNEGVVAAEVAINREGKMWRAKVRAEIEGPPNPVMTIRAPNTRITYMYRDASNYKHEESIVLAGEVSHETSRLLALRSEADVMSGGCLVPDFIPGQVGLPDLQEFVSADWDGEVDHPFHEMIAICATDEDADPQHASAEEVMKLIVVTQWDQDYVPAHASADSPTFG